MTTDQLILLIFLIIIPFAAVFLSRKINQRISSREVEIVIITDNEHYSEIQEITDLEAMIKTVFKESTYAAGFKDAWTKKKSIMDRLKGVERYLVMFFEFVEDEDTMIKPINKATVPETTSDILYKIKKYRGVNPALEGQFKESGGGIPNWILIIVLFAVLVLGLIAALQLGLISMPLGVGNP